MDPSLRIPVCNRAFSTQAALPSSKSIANRVIVLDALWGKLRPQTFYGNAQDIKDLWRILSNYKTASIHDAGIGGTTFRFALAFLSTKAQAPIQLIAGEQLSNRPLDPLLGALGFIGAHFSTSWKDNRRTIVITPAQKQQNKDISIDLSQSSQFASALALVASHLPFGLKLHFASKPVSRSYLYMTHSVLQASNVRSELTMDQWTIAPLLGDYTPMKTIEKDWSAAVFFLCLVCLKPKSKLFLPDLHLSGVQGDESICFHLSPLGLKWKENIEGMYFYSRPSRSDRSYPVSIDIENTPDHGPALLLTLALMRQPVQISGISHLRYKESDRLAALEEILRQMNVTFKSDNQCLELVAFPRQWPPSITVDVKGDHRLAMAASLLSTSMSVVISEPECVGKSFPQYWQEFEKTQV